MNNLEEIFRRNLRIERAKRDLTQAALGETIGMCPSNISLIERGKYGGTLKTVAKVAEGLGIPAWHLLVDREDPMAIAKDRVRR